MEPFDICPFALPNASQKVAANTKEFLFEDPRDINGIEVHFKGAVTSEIQVEYMQKIWPSHRIENIDPFGDPFSLGWFPIDDHYNTPWRTAAIEVVQVDAGTALITFKPLSDEMPDAAGYDVKFRRTLGIKISVGGLSLIDNVRIFTESAAITSKIKVRLDSGSLTDTTIIGFKLYNTQIKKITPESGLAANGAKLVTTQFGKRDFVIELQHMAPSHHFCNDNGLVTFVLDSNEFTISLESLKDEGPIWYKEAGIYITFADSTLSFEDYIESASQTKSILPRLSEEKEQSFAGPFNGQPRPHAVPYSVGCKGSRHRFWIEPCGDFVLTHTSVDWVKASDTPRFKNKLDGRFFFGFERWQSIGRFTDPSPIVAYNINMIYDGLVMEQKSYAVPLLKSIFDELAGDDTTTAMVRFRFRNDGDKPEQVDMPIEYASDAYRVCNRLAGKGGGIRPQNIDDRNLPICGREQLSLSPIDGTSAKAVHGLWNDKTVLRCVIETEMQTTASDGKISIKKELQPGESCDVLVKIPYVSLDSDDEIRALTGLDFDSCYRDVAKFWRDENRKGAQVITPEPRLNALYAAHLSYVHVTDFVMPNDHYLINTSVGTSTYPNFSNEACMIIQELDQRGLHEEVRRRLSVWLKYQSTAKLIGNFTDYDGVFYGAGGFECGETYDQHHGWILWYLAEHYFMTRDDEWMRSIADSIINGADWAFRQRKNTMAPDMPNSRGLESGFIPAGSLEDVADFFYWLSTNTMTWRGVNNTAKALEAINHPEAPRIRESADEYGKSLIEGFNKACRLSPLVKLRDGRWVPHFPSRLYRRGRDIGWIREVLEGAVYLLISGLYDANSAEAGWILEDYLDNRYIKSPYTYVMWRPETNWFDYGGFSPQPNLLAGLMPHLDRDEPETYIYMFFNAWVSCYREEINAMVEHPCPILGFSNDAHPKTSDEANAVMWLRYMYVYGNNSGLYIGRAIPREWFSDGKKISAERVSTKYGDVSICYESEAAKGIISASADLDIRKQPAQTLIRIRHPEKLPIASVTLNGYCIHAVRPD